ncbi:MAG: hypothetical protein C0617_07720 [Desulfuromonas sp.]|nr:MAG: hypothetical protein C0617_07720 [Desulfuromonas sp.]
MELFDRLLTDLGAIAQVREIGLADPGGVINYANRPQALATSLDEAFLQKTLSERESLHHEELGDDLLLARPQRLESACLECHEERREGEVAGILYIRFSLEKLRGAEAAMEAALGAARKKSAALGAAAGAAALIVAALGIYLLLGVLVRRPLERLREMMVDLEAGRLVKRLGMSQGDEIGQTAHAMDTLADSLQNEVIDSLQKLAKGDLTFSVTPRCDEDAVRGALKKLGDDLNGLMGQTQTAGDQIAIGSAQIAASGQSLSQGATQSAAAVEQITASMTELASQTQTNADNANQAHSLSAEARSAAEMGGQKMQEMSAAMEEINQSGQDISRIIQAIDEIAFQTNLLALNAAIEAARAGQHGRGFAVVAEEVRNLAGRSAKAARETSELIESSVDKTQKGAMVAARTAEALDSMVDKVTRVTDLMTEIAAASSEQALGIGQVNQGLGQIDQVTQQNTGSAEESAAAAEELSAQAAQLRENLARFKLRPDGSEAMPAPDRTVSFAPPAESDDSGGWGSPAPGAPEDEPFGNA